MSTIQRVLFPVDFSSSCQALVPTIRRMMECWRAEVTLLHVMESGHWFERRHELERPLLQMRAIAETGLQAPGARCRLERGEPAERILEYVRANSVDLVVIPASRSPRLHGRAVGSVADRVLAEARCPVWLDWGSARSQTTAGMFSQRVCCALELNDSDEPVMQGAAGIAVDLGADLTMVHAVSPPPGRPLMLLWDPKVRDREVGRAKRRLEELRRRFQPSAEVAVEIGPSRSVVSRTILNAATGLLVTGNCRDAILAAESECPVLRIAMPATSAEYATQAQPLYETAVRRSA